MKWRNAVFAASLTAGGVFGVSGMIEGAKNLSDIPEADEQTSAAEKARRHLEASENTQNSNTSTLPALWRVGAAVGLIGVADQARARQVRHDERRDALPDSEASSSNEFRSKDYVVLGELALAPVIIEQGPAADNNIDVSV
jgi:hypothetical protein